jgi:hypothetical protein
VQHHIAASYPRARSTTETRRSTHECTDFLEDITNQLSSHFQVAPTDEGCTVVTPFLYPDNTQIEVEVLLTSQGRTLITDNGQASDYAFVNGAGERQIRSRLQFVGKRFGIQTDGEELVVETTRDKLGDGILTLLNGIQDIASTVYRQPERRQQPDFDVDVERFLVQLNRPYRKNQEVRGHASRMNVDYVVQGNGAKQLMLFTIEPRKGPQSVRRAKEIAFGYMDLSKVPSAPPVAVLIDDRGPSVENAHAEETTRILTEYLPHVISWDSRHELEELLAA